jgi:hypothetical protein
MKVISMEEDQMNQGAEPVEEAVAPATTRSGRPPLDAKMLKEVVRTLNSGLSAEGVEETVRHIMENPEAVAAYVERAKSVSRAKPERDFAVYREKLGEAEALLAKAWRPGDPTIYLKPPVLTPWEAFKAQAVGLVSKSRLEAMTAAYLPRIMSHVREQSLAEWEQYRSFFKEQSDRAEARMNGSLDSIDTLYAEMTEAKHNILVYQEALKGMDGRAAKLEERLAASGEPDYKSAIARRKEGSALRKDKEIFQEAIESSARRIHQDFRRILVQQQSYYQARSNRITSQELHGAFDDAVEAVKTYEADRQSGLFSTDLLDGARISLKRANGIVQLYDKGYGHLVEAVKAWSGEVGLEASAPAADLLERIRGQEETRRKDIDDKVERAFSIMEQVETLYPA